MRIPWHLCIIATVAWAGGEPPPASTLGVVSEQALGEASRLRDDLVRRARRGAWPGVEDTYLKLGELGVPLAAGDHQLGAQAALVAGEPWQAYQRLVRALQVDAEAPEVREMMRDLRARFGRLTVRRVEASPIELTQDEPPFAPDERAAVLYAAERLQATGGFDGMVPIGRYRLGSRDIEVVPGLKALVVQRETGDSASAP